MTPIDRLVANGNRIIQFLKDFASPTAQDVSLNWIKDDSTIDTTAVPNIKKYQEDTTATVNAAIANIKQPKIVFKGWDSGHNQEGASWQRVPFKWQEIPAVAPYCTVPNGADAITINTAGLYRFDVFIVKHKDNVDAIGHTEINHNGNIVVRTNERWLLNGGWQSYSLNYSAHFNAGDYLIIGSFQYGSNPYNWHMGGIHGHATLTYLGD